MSAAPRMAIAARGNPRCPGGGGSVPPVRSPSDTPATVANRIDGSAVEEVLAAVEDDVCREHAEQGEAAGQVGSEDASRLEASPVQLRASATRRR